MRDTDGLTSIDPDEIRDRRRDEYDSDREPKAKGEKETPIDSYLADMKRYCRVTHDQEHVLGRVVKVGREMMVKLILDSAIRSKDLKLLQKDVTDWLEKKNRPNPTESEAMRMMRDRLADLAARHPSRADLADLHRRTARIYAKVRRAMDKLITANLRLVVKVAKGYTNRGFSLEDLIQEGNLGLIKAAGKYDYTTGNRFCTYAIWWIRQSIVRAIYDKGRTIRLPVHLLETRNSFYQSYYRLLIELGREPDPEEVAEVMGESPDKIVSMIQSMKDPIDLDAPRGDDEDTSLAEVLAAEGQPSPFESVSYRQLLIKLKVFLKELPEREEHLLSRRFGLGTDEKCTLVQLGRELNISRERVRQIENQALERLRKPEILKVLGGL